MLPFLKLKTIKYLNRIPVFILLMLISEAIVLEGCIRITEPDNKTNKRESKNDLASKNSLDTQMSINSNVPKFESILVLSSNSKSVDEYNVRQQIVEFRNPVGGNLIKTIDLVNENPFHKKGFVRRKEPFHCSDYFLMKKGNESKYDLKEFLPKSVFSQIPSNFPFDRAIATVFVSKTLQKYVTVSYELEWLPDAYSDEGEWDGPGYGVHWVTVYDSLGEKVYSKQFDGTSVRPSISDDGKYLFTMACLSPEWDKNIKYRFTMVNIKTNKIVFEEWIENCKKNGGSGDFYTSEKYADTSCNPYYVSTKNDTSIIYLYCKGRLYFHEDSENIHQWYFSENGQIKVIYDSGESTVVDFDKFFQSLKLNQ